MAENLNDLRAFVVVARMGSFTKAAGHIGVSQSALSYTIRTLEEHVGIKLLNRTTRSVSPTQAGEQLLNDIEPLINDIDKKLNGLNTFRDSPRGFLRITGSEHVINTLLWDKFSKFAKDYPDITLEITTDYTMTDIVKERYDVGIRLRDTVDKDMVAVRVTPDMRMALVASNDYLQTNGIPQSVNELDEHRCVVLRLPTRENIMNWEFRHSNSKQPQDTIVYRPQSAMIVSHSHLLVKSVIDGLGVAWLPKTMIHNELNNGTLNEILPEWAITYDGYYMYYPSRNVSPLFRLLVEALKFESEVEN